MAARYAPRVTQPSTGHGPPFDPSAPPVPPSPAFEAACAEAGLAFEPGELDRYARYLGFLADANRRFNLTAVSEPAAMWMRHIYDSLSLLPVIGSMEELANSESGLRILDVGSGGGLPGIPLAIALPASRVALLEATGKKVRFLQAVVEAIGLRNVTVLQGRAEDLGRDREHHREQYDLVTSRAVATLPALLEVTVPFARPGGFVLAIKGEKAGEEIVAAKAALHALHAHVLEPIRTPTGTIVPIQKMRTTPKLYPRRAGEPERAPIR